MVTELVYFSKPNEICKSQSNVSYGWKYCVVTGESSYHSVKIV